MRISFVHSSDWHIGKPFGQHDDGVAAILRQARLTAIDRLADAARSGNAGLVLVAGDTFDRPSLSDRDLRAPLLQMQTHRELTWHIIPGNHDPASAGGIWERVQRLGLPPNVIVHLEARPTEIARECWLLPSPLAAKAMTQDPTAWMDLAPTPEGALRIGLAHGSVQGFGSEQKASIEIAPDRARRAGLGYMALGDWHGVREIGRHTAYSGTPEPDGFLDNAPGHALLVSFDGAQAPPQITRRTTGEHRWLKRSIATTQLSALAELEGEVEGLGAQARHVLLALELVGRVSIEQERSVRLRIDRLEARVLHLERQLSRLVPQPENDDIERLPDDTLRDLARELSSHATSDDRQQAQVSARALRHLFELSDSVTATQAGTGP